MGRIELEFPKTNFSDSSETNRLMNSSENFDDGWIASSERDVTWAIASCFSRGRAGEANEVTAPRRAVQGRSPGSECPPE